MAECDPELTRCGVVQPAAASHTHGASQPASSSTNLWRPALPPLPTYVQLYDQLSDTKKILAEKDQQLAEKDQQLKHYADRTAALEDQLHLALQHHADRIAPQLVGTEPTASAVQSSAAVQFTATAPPPAASSSAAAEPHGTAVTAQQQYEYGGDEALQPAPAVPPPAPQPSVCFSIVTFGLKTLNLAKRNHDNDVIVRALTAFWPAFHADVLTDARPFHDPDQWNVGHGHTGMHRDIMYRIATHPRFYTWYQQQIDRVLAASPQHRRPGYADVGVAIYCNAGRHRSVAASIFLEVGLRKHGRHATVTRHLSSDTWPSCRGGCPQCTGAYATAERLLHECGLL